MLMENKTACISLNTVLCETKSQSLGLYHFTAELSKESKFGAQYEKNYSKTFQVF